jgi:hypothetical protein
MPNCFQSIEQITLDDGIVGLLCGCYGRLFASGNERYKRLTTKLWHEFIDNSREKDPIGHAFIEEISEGALNRPLVNPSAAPNYDRWCPLCQRNRKIGIISLWLSPKEKFVATYGVCRACARRYTASSKEQQDAIIQLCEDRLLEQYPFLAQALTNQ